MMPHPGFDPNTLPFTPISEDPATGAAAFHGLHVTPLVVCPGCQTVIAVPFAAVKLSEPTGIVCACKCPRFWRIGVTVNIEVADMPRPSGLATAHLLPSPQNGETQPYG